MLVQNKEQKNIAVRQIKKIFILLSTNIKINKQKITRIAINYFIVYNANLVQS